MEIIFVLFSPQSSAKSVKVTGLAAVKGVVIKGLHIFCPAGLLKFSFKVRNFSDGWL